jgi:hypothetical protein
MRIVSAALVAAAVSTPLVLAAAGAHATTQPGMLSVSQVVIDDHAILVRIRRHRWASSVHYLRGAEVRYEVSNRGTRPISLDILGSVTGVLRPGRHGSMLVYWSHRGRYVFRVQPHGPRLRVAVD